MAKSKFLKDSQAEFDSSVSSLTIFYKIGLWIPIIISLITGVVGIILIANTDFDKFVKIFSIVGIVVGVIADVFLILVIQAIYRLNIYHLERINYNTTVMCESLIELVKKNKINENKENQSVESTNILEEEYLLATNGINQMINMKLINDKQFELYIKSLISLGEYKDSNKLIDLYKKKYNEIKNNTVQKEDQDSIIMKKLNNLLKDKRISSEKYNEYSSILANISKCKNETDKQSQYKKLMMILDLY